MSEPDRWPAKDEGPNVLVLVESMKRVVIDCLL